jgi:hypothetical protein
LENNNQALSWLLSQPCQLEKNWILGSEGFSFKSEVTAYTWNPKQHLSHLSDGPHSELSLVPCNALLTHFLHAFQDFAVHQRADLELSHIIKSLDNKDKVLQYYLFKSVLHCQSRFDHKGQIVVTLAMTLMLFQYYHMSPLGGHLETFKMFNKFWELFIWRGIGNNIWEQVHQCVTCSMIKPVQNFHFGFFACEVLQQPFLKFYIDYVGKFTFCKAENTVILVCVVTLYDLSW